VLAEKLSQVYVGDLTNEDKLKEFIQKEVNISDDEDLQVILSKIDELNKSDNDTN
jgi:hypothetical protein